MLERAIDTHIDSVSERAGPTHLPVFCSVPVSSLIEYIDISAKARFHAVLCLSRSERYGHIDE